MRMHPFVIGLSVLAGSIGVIRSGAAEEYRGTFAQQMACTPDVIRLCGSAMPDVTRIVACLRQNEMQLGASCKAVFESNAEATPGDIAPKQPAPGQADGTPGPAPGAVRGAAR
jgi:hypothetical protein